VCSRPWWVLAYQSQLARGANWSQTILAVYYTIADLVLLLQCFYYRGFTWHDEARPPLRKPANRVGEPNERTGLLHPEFERERRGSDWSNLSPAIPIVPETREVLVPPPTTVQSFSRNTVAVVMVCGAGVLGWYLSPKTSGPDSDGTPEEMVFNFWGQVFGYLCAALYILSRLPQLVLNWRRKSTDGLSMLFFLFACLGNVTYVLSILAFEPRCKDDRCAPGEALAIYGRYMLLNLSWLMGSFFTFLLDLGVFVQYFLYGTKKGEFDAVDEEDAESIDEERWERPLLARGDSTLG
jgi:solute carrier family 66 (lysosomal lysine-arginine transporter), member 1